MTDSFVRYPGISPSVPSVSSYSAKDLSAAESLQLVWPEDGADPDTVLEREAAQREGVEQVGGHAPMVSRVRRRATGGGRRPR